MKSTEQIFTSVWVCFYLVLSVLFGDFFVFEKEQEDSCNIQRLLYISDGLLLRGASLVFQCLTFISIL